MTAEEIARGLNKLADQPKRELRLAVATVLAGVGLQLVASGNGSAAAWVALTAGVGMMVYEATR